MATWADEGAKWELDGGCDDPGEVTHQQVLRTYLFAVKLAPVLGSKPSLSLSSWLRTSS